MDLSLWCGVWSGSRGKRKKSGEVVGSRKISDLVVFYIDRNHLTLWTFLLCGVNVTDLSTRKEIFPAVPDSKKKHSGFKVLEWTGLLADLCARGHEVFIETTDEAVILYILPPLMFWLIRHDRVIKAASAERQPVITQDLSSPPRRRGMKK